MAFLPAVRAAAAAYRDTRKSVTTYPIPGATSTAEAWRAWDAITNGWAAVSSAWGAFWSALREWGGTDYKALASAIVANPVAGRAMNLLCDAAAAAPLVAYRERAGVREEQPESPMLAAVERSGWGALTTAYMWGIYCGGEAWFVREAPTTGPNAGRVRALRPLPNHLYTRTDYDALGDPVRYVFARPGKQGGTDAYDAADVLHIRRHNPIDTETGLPVVVSARRPLTIVEEADAWNRGIAKGGGRVPGYFSPQGLMPGTVMDSAKVQQAQDLSDQATLDRRHKNLPQVLSGAFTFQDAGVTPKDADWLKGRQVAMREIAAVMGVPATLLADEKAGSLTDAGVDSEVAALYKLTVQPLLTRFLEALNGFMGDESEEIAVDWDQVPALQEDMDAKYARYISAVDVVVSQREARVALGWSAVPEPGMEFDAQPEPAPVLVPDETKALTADAFERLLNLIPASA